MKAQQKKFPKNLLWNFIELKKKIIIITKQLNILDTSLRSLKKKSIVLNIQFLS